MKEELNNNKGAFNTPLSSMDRSSRTEINNIPQALNNTVGQMNLIDIYRSFHLKATEYIFFSSAHGTFLRIDYMLGHKASISKFKEIKVTSSIFSDHDVMRLKINYKKKKKTKKFKHMRTKQ